MEYINCVYYLVQERWTRYGLSQDKEDLNKSILHCTEAIFLPPVSRDRPHLNNVFQLLFLITFALLELSEFDLPEDVKPCIEYLRYLRGLTPDSFDVPRNDVTTSLIRALDTQVRLGTSDGIRNIREMLILCRELLSSNISADFPVAAFRALDQAVDAEYNRGRSIPLLDEVIDCLQDAVKICPPGSYRVLFALANQLFTRFTERHSNNDYEEAMAQLETILDPNQSIECPDSIRNMALSLSTTLAYDRSSIFKNPEYAEVAISRLRTFLSSPSINEGLRLRLTESLAIQTRLRFTQYNIPEGLEEADSYTSQAAGLSSSRSFAQSGEIYSDSDAVRGTYSDTAMQQKIQDLEELLSINPPGTERHKRCLSVLADWYESKFSRTNELSDIEESIKYNRLSLDATDPSHPWRHIALASLRNVLYLAFAKTRKIRDLDESITLSYDILELRGSQHLRFQVTQTLVQFLRTREKLLGRREDRHEAIRLISTVVDEDRKSVV